jgi:hypothetical protein
MASADAPGRQVTGVEVPGGSLAVEVSSSAGLIAEAMTAEALS